MIAQNADVIPATANGVVATAKATKAPKRILPINAFSRASRSEDTMARPAIAKMYVFGSTFKREATGLAAKAKKTVNKAEMMAA